MNTIWKYGKKIGKELKEDRATGLAAEQAYYYLLAIFPLLILLISIVPYLQLDQENVLSTLQGVLPADTFTLIEDNIINIITVPSGGLLTFGIIGTLWSASNGVQAFIRAMNSAFDVEETRSFIKVRLTSIGLTIGLVFAILIAMLLPVFGRPIIDLISSIINIPGNIELIVNILRYVIAVAVMITILALLYKLAPNKHYPFKHVLPGAVIATIMWQLISFGLSIYVNNFADYSGTYGSLGGVIVLMLWFYLTGLALVIGGEINALYHKEKSGQAVMRERRVSF